MRGEAILAKITRPRLTRNHERTDLLNLLDELRTASLIMISGLPGAGKTALVASYADSRNIPCLWYQVDQDDEDLANFFHYLGLAARELNPLSKANMPLPTTGCLAGDPVAVAKYFSDLYKCLEIPFLVVFDKYQNISEDSVVHRVIRDACTVLPIGGRIILITSNDCPPTVACLRANRSTAIIGWQELQLNPGKVKEVAALHGLTLPLEDAAKQLERKVGAWAAEMVLSLQKTRDA
jgi:LuxR family maltose regulon positive regulatory protein